MKTTLKQNYTMKLTTLACLVAGIAGITPALQAAATTDSVAVSKMLAQAKTQAYSISVDADALESYTREPSLSWESHVIEISRMREDINAAGKTLASLTSSRAQASPWQVAAIDRIIPFLQEIASDTTAAIEYLNKNHTQLATKREYTDYIEANADTSKELSTLIAHFVDYGNRKSRYDSLRSSLELPAK